MWIKTPEGNLLNLDTGTAIKMLAGNVMLELPVRDFNDLYLNYDEEITCGSLYKKWQFNDDHGDQINFEYKWIAEFGNDDRAQEYINKLAQKLGAEEI